MSTANSGDQSFGDLDRPSAQMGHSKFGAMIELTGRMIAILLGAVFLVSGLSKVRNLYAFLVTLYQFEIVGPGARD